MEFKFRSGFHSASIDKNLVQTWTQTELHFESKLRDSKEEARGRDSATENADWSFDSRLDSKFLNFLQNFQFCVFLKSKFVLA